MYIPKSFSQQNPESLHDFIDNHPFGVLVSQIDSLPFATHLPFLLKRTSGPHGTLFAHLARANPHAQAMAEQTALVIFHGPHAYISPAWYESQNAVPTWNYVAVHAYGRVKLIEDPSRLRELLEQSIHTFEQFRPHPWTLNADPSYVNRLMEQIVGFQIEIENLEGKWKLSQNQPVERRQKVIAALETQSDDQSQGMAAWMRKALANPERADG